MARTTFTGNRKPVSNIKKTVTGIRQNATSGNWRWNGTNDLPISDLLILSFWIKMNATLSGLTNILSNSSGRSTLQIFSGAPQGQVRLYNFDTVPNPTARLDTNTGALTVGNWGHVLMSYDNKRSIGQIYVDDVESNQATTFFSNANPADLSGSLLDILPTTEDVSLAELYFNPYSYMDMSLVANRRKFISSDLKPVDLGAEGHYPTGSKPHIYLSGGVSEFFTNTGSGVDPTDNNTTPAVTDSPDSPSD